jgi:hypothetical protein
MPLMLTNLDSAQLRRRQRPHEAAAHGRAERVQSPAVAGPDSEPDSTQFGQVTTVAANQMRFFTFGA